MTEFLAVTTVVSLGISAAALIVAIRALKNDETTRADTGKVAAEANELQARARQLNREHEAEHADRTRRTS